MTPADAREVLGPVLAEAVEVLVAERVALAVADLDLAADPWPAYLDVPTAARFLGVTPERVRKLLAAGKLARIQEAPGHRVLVARPDLDALAREWRQEVRPEH